jgi:hypothetical protein
VNDLDEWEARRLIFRQWRTRREADKALDERLGRLGFKPSSGYHAEGCTIGMWVGALCTCDRVVGRRESRRRRRRRAELLIR